MTTLDVIYMAAAGSCLWLGRWNVTCWALALAYVVVEAWAWIEFPGRLDAGDLFLVDIITIMLITCKAIASHPGIEPYENGWEHVRAFLAAPSFCDRLILGLFILAVWPAYLYNIHDFNRWALLWGAGMAQFIIAGGESLHNYSLHRRAAKALPKEPEEPPGPYRIAWAGVETWQT